MSLRHAQAGRLEIARALCRTRGPDDDIAKERLAATPHTGGTAVLPPLHFASERVAGDDECATWALSVQNTGDQPVHVESVGLGFRWRAPTGAGLRILRQGYQSWSFAGAVALDGDGTPPFPSGPWLRGFHHATGEPPSDRRDWHESDGLGAVGLSPRGAACVAGALESGRAFAVVYVRAAGAEVDVDVEQRVEHVLAPGEVFECERVRVALGTDIAALLEAHADAHGTHAGARTRAPFQSGWCTWYHFFHDVSEERFLRNLAALADARDEIPIDVVQLDDGYQREIGDWTSTNAKFPSGLPAIAKAVRDAGFRPGLWTAPFCVVPGSRPFDAHPEWLLRDGAGDPLRGLLHPEWTSDGQVFVLDPTHADVERHLVDCFAELVAMGFSYLKLDFLYVAALRGIAFDRGATRAARLRRGLDAVRAGAGPDAYLLGCGCPLGPAVGVVDGMRIGPDTAPHWEPLEEARIPGLEATLPGGHNALRNTLARAYQHRRLWQNDPDCLLARSSETRLTPDELRTLAGSIAVTGGATVFSDDLAALAPGDRARIRETLFWARRVDDTAQVGTARALAPLCEGDAAGAVARAGGDGLVFLVNAGDARAWCEIGADEVRGLDIALDAPLEPLLGSPMPAHHDATRIGVELPAHGSALYRLCGEPRMAVFCDFDGTFAVQDVGSTLVRRHAGERRAALWERLSRGELTPWAYNLELLEGLALPEVDLEAFLQTVDLDPGARELVAWCERERLPFRILSDGFDRNLDRLQAIHGVRFAYDANHLHYEAGAWRIAAGAPDPACGCGTGTCKRARIEAFRAEHPGVPVAHVGNGRVSDLCGARAANFVFAKDSLADELDAQGIAYHRFETLRDVVAVLEGELAAREA